MSDLHPFGEQDKPEEGISERPDENIPLNPRGGTWKPEREQETPFGGMSLRTKVLREHVKALYHAQSGNLRQTSEVFH